ncbi:uncharacterized protein LOC109827936, partial [Asparagus officinalis]|uniref:uncharacterized protein LOC109827936 n=1 Tax=Asparagus officinalis TaxID=4686 RepID=UPI00098E34BF
MVCISTPKYSISLNGALHGYFKGERRLRQGDPLSPYLFILGMEYLSRTLGLLEYDKRFKYHPKCGLQMNKEKSTVFFGGVEDSVKETMRAHLYPSEGSFPIRYLGVPLICKRLSYEDCNSLISMVSSQIQAWNKIWKLSYAGRLQ